MSFAVRLNRQSCMPCIETGLCSLCDYTQSKGTHFIYKVCAFESIKNNLCCQALASPLHLKVSLLISGSFRSTTLHIPQEVAGLVVGVGLFIIFQNKMSLGVPLKLLTCFKCLPRMACPWSDEFKGCLPRTLGSSNLL